MKEYPKLEHNTYILAKDNFHGHHLSFEKYSNCGWSKELVFLNGGLPVHLLKLDMSKVSKVKTTVDAYLGFDKDIE